MQALQNKIRVVYLPFLLIAVCCVAGYSFLNWLLIIETGFTGLGKEVVNFWLPFCIPWIPIHFWLRPRLRALRLAGGKGGRGRGDRPFAFSMVAALAIAAPTVVGQHYLETATGVKSDLARIEQIDAVPRTKYYNVRNVSFDKAQASETTGAKIVGRYNETAELAVYLVCPIGGTANQLGFTSSCWLGTVYKDRVSSHLSDGERQERFRAFIRQSEDNYRRLDLGAFTYLERVGISDDRRGLEEAVKRSPLFPPDASFTVLLVHHDNFDERNGSKLAWVLGSFGIGSVIWFIMLAFAPIDRTEMNRLLRGEKTATAPAFPYSRFFIPRGGYFVTPILIDFNVLVFVVMVFAGLGFTSFATKDLFAWGGNLRSAVLAGQSWRLVTSMFIHGGAMHLVGNLFGLFLAGTLLEPVFGRIGFLLCYFLSGVAGGVASVDWHANTVSIGASGAIFGLMGAIVGFSLLNHSKSSFAKNHVIGFVLFFLGYNFLLGLFGGATDNADHLGGLACGLMLGVFFHLFPSLLPHRHPVGSKSEAHP